MAVGSVLRCKAWSFAFLDTQLKVIRRTALDALWQKERSWRSPAICLTVIFKAHNWDPEMLQWSQSLEAARAHMLAFPEWQRRIGEIVGLPHAKGLRVGGLPQFLAVIRGGTLKKMATTHGHQLEAHYPLAALTQWRCYESRCYASHSCWRD